MIPFSLAAALWASALCLQAADTIADRINAAQSAGQYAEAAKLYGQLVATGSDTPEIRSNWGVMLHLAGKNREALAQFHIALRKNNDLAGANLFAGLSEFDLDDLPAALPFLSRAQQLDPTGPAPILALGKVYVGLRDYAHANDSFAKAVQLDPKLFDAWYGLGVTDRSLAEAILNQAARQGAARNDATKEKVQHLLANAAQALSHAVDLDPNSARTHLLMAESLSDADKLVEAIPEYEAAMKLDPKLDAAYLGLATEYWKQREFDKATPLLHEVLTHSPRDPEANAIMADILEHNGDTVGAERHADLALAGNPDLIQTRIVRARIYLLKQQPKLAISEIRRVLPADPDGSYHFLLYRACHQAGDEEGASKAMAEFQQLRSTPAPR